MSRHTGPRPHNDPEYRNAKRWLRAHPETRCWFDGCDAPATTIDHVPAIVEHQHLRGSRCCELRPACRSCNCSHGARIGNARRELRTPW